MPGSGSRVIKLSSGMKPFVSRVSRHGAVQVAFAEQIGRPVGNCVKSAVHAGMGSGEIKKAVRQCAKQSSGTVLDIAGARARLRGRGRRLAPVAGEYFEYFEVE